MNQIPDDPRITVIENTGYPAGMKSNPVCPSCGDELEDVTFRIGGECVCAACFKSWVNDQLDEDPKEIAYALGVTVEREV